MFVCVVGGMFICVCLFGDGGKVVCGGRLCLKMCGGPSFVQSIFCRIFCFKLKLLQILLQPVILKRDNFFFNLRKKNSKFECLMHTVYFCSKQWCSTIFLIFIHLFRQKSLYYIYITSEFIHLFIFLSFFSPYKRSVLYLLALFQRNVSNFFPSIFRH